MNAGFFDSLFFFNKKRFFDTKQVFKKHVFRAVCMVNVFTNLEPFALSHFPVLIY